MEKVKVKISDVLSLLDQGKTRKEIGEHYNLSNNDVKAMFLHPELKGRRTKAKKEVGFVFEEDTTTEEEGYTMVDVVNEIKDQQEEETIEVAQKDPEEQVGFFN